MATITKAQIKAAFALAEAVYDGKLTFETAAAELRDQHGLNINSARDFIGNYRHTLSGEVFKRSLSASALEYFLPGIERSRGRDAADNAVAATWKHIAYYEAIEDTRLTKLRSVVEEFQASFGGPVSAQVQESSFGAAVVQSTRDSPAVRRKRLEEANATPTVITTQTKVFVRNPDVVAEVLARAKGICEICKKPAPFLRKTDGTPYLEVHHKEQLAHGGKDTVQNAVAVCPNCHRQQHHGEILPPVTGSQRPGDSQRVTSNAVGKAGGGESQGEVGRSHCSVLCEVAEAMSRSCRPTADGSPAQAG